MRVLHDDSMAQFSAGSQFENWAGVCNGMKAGAVMYDVGVLFLGWTPVGWVCFAFSIAVVACMSAGY